MHIRKVQVEGQVSPALVCYVCKSENAASKEAQLGLDWIVANQKKD